MKTRCLIMQMQQKIATMPVFCSPPSPVSRISFKKKKKSIFLSRALLLGNSTTKGPWDRVAEGEGWHLNYRWSPTFRQNLLVPHWALFRGNDLNYRERHVNAMSSLATGASWTLPYTVSKLSFWRLTKTFFCPGHWGFSGSQAGNEQLSGALLPQRLGAARSPDLASDVNAWLFANETSWLLI